MATKSRAKAKATAKTQTASLFFSEGSRIKLQIAATVFVPMLALGIWLNSKGFFG